MMVVLQQSFFVFFFTLAKFINCQYVWCMLLYANSSIANKFTTNSVFGFLLLFFNCLFICLFVAVAIVVVIVTIIIIIIK